MDSGYQGIDSCHKAEEFPYKSCKNKPLNAEEKAENQALSRIGMKVEPIIGNLKTFSDRYRNKRKRYTGKFMIIAGIVTLKNGFRAASMSIAQETPHHFLSFHFPHKTH